MNIVHKTNSIINNKFPYWKTLSKQEKKLANKYLSIFKNYLPVEMRYHYYNLKGQIIYRCLNKKSSKYHSIYPEKYKKHSLWHGNKLDAKKLLYKSYLMLKAKSKTYRQVVKIPFFMKGFFLVGGTNSYTAVTHMGYNHNCYDIMGLNKNLMMTKPNSNIKKLKNWYGFNKTVYSPVTGKVIKVIDNGNDDPVYPKKLGKILNYIAILSQNKIFLFAHLKKHSALVNEGDKVKIGQPIARMGNSSSYIPHIHFGVYSSDNLISLPVKFINYNVYKNGKFKYVKTGRPGLHENKSKSYYYINKKIIVRTKNLLKSGMQGFQAIYNEKILK
jgi:hypothetical protein